MVCCKLGQYYRRENLHLEQKRATYKFLYILRFIGVSLIVYDHLGALRNPDWIVARVLEYWLNKPLGLIQSFGAFAVCLFLVISGFCLTTTSKNGLTFIYNKVVKIIGTLFLSTVLFYIFNILFSHLTAKTYWDQFSVIDWLKSGTLLCYVQGKESAINGAIWYLFPLMFLYLFFGLLYGIIKKHVIYLPILIDIFFILLIILNSVGVKFLPVMQWLVFALIPIFGYLIRSVYEKKISFKVFLVTFFINYMVLVESIITFRGEYYMNQPYLISMIFALSLFGIFLAFEEKIVLPRFVKFISDISFSIYLLHMTFGSLFMTGLVGRLGFTLSFIVSVCLVVLLSWGQFYWIEKRVITKLR